jgi:hypothetical protein
MESRRIDFFQHKASHCSTNKNFTACLLILLSLQIFFFYFSCINYLNELLKFSTSLRLCCNLYCILNVQQHFLPIFCCDKKNCSNFEGTRNFLCTNGHGSMDRLNYLSILSYCDIFLINYFPLELIS